MIGSRYMSTGQSRWLEFGLFYMEWNGKSIADGLVHELVHELAIGWSCG